MNAEITTALEYGTDRPCQVGRIEYRIGVYGYVALTFRYLEKPYAWRLTWLGERGERAAQLPEGIAPSSEMLKALTEALADTPCECGRPRHGYRPQAWPPICRYCAGEAE